MEQDLDVPPTFWLQPPQTTTRRRTPPPIDPVILIILIPVFALIILFFFLPPFLTHTSNILKPASVKSTWDSINIFLVIFAILCGVLARRNDDVSPSSGENSFVTENSSSNISGGEWVEFSERKVVSGGLRRNSSSYPDLRQQSLWEDVEIRNRFYDDLSPVSRYYNNLSRQMAVDTEFSGDNFRRSLQSEPDVVEFSDVKEIEVDTFEVKNSPSKPPPPPPLPPPPPAAKSKRHSFRSVGRKSESDEFENVKSYTPPPAPPPPPPPQLRMHKSRNKHKKLERKVSDATKEIATAISSLYNQNKRKGKRKSRNVSSSSDSSPPSVHFGSPEETKDLLQMVTRTPPPPPPPPPPTMFQNLFKKGGKHKRIHSVSLTVPPPPPPPPPSSIFNNIFKSGNKSKRFQSPSAAPPPPPPLPSSIMNNLFKTGTKSKRFNSLPPPPPPPPPPMTPPRYFISESWNRRSTSNGKPPLPTKTSYYEREEFLPSGSQSPLIPMPPPPPPFKMSAMKFELRGDFVRIRSTHSSVCSSPDRDAGITDGVDLVGPRSGSTPEHLFFPSPDVNAKADSFISRLKDEWRMEKINHVKDKMG